MGEKNIYIDDMALFGEGMSEIINLTYTGNEIETICRIRLNNLGEERYSISILNTSERATEKLGKRVRKHEGTHSKESANKALRLIQYWCRQEDKEEEVKPKEENTKKPAAENTVEASIASGLNKMHSELEEILNTRRRERRKGGGFNKEASLEEKLMYLKNNKCAVICENKQQAKELFKLKFPYTIGREDLYEAEEWEDEYSKQGFTFDSGTNGYSWAGFFEEEGDYELIHVKEVISKKEYKNNKPEPNKKMTNTSRTIEEMIYNLAKENIESKESKEIIIGTVKKKLDEWGIVPNKVELYINDVAKETITKAGAQHEKFSQILTCLKAKVNIALVGAAGSGKTTCVKEVAKALSLNFYSKSVSAQTGTHEFFGYQDANGNYVSTDFRKAFQEGGVFLLDEFDAGNPNVLATLNQATANEECSFADGMVNKHEDFIVVMAGNTFGHGATSEYVGRNKIDAATLDRFAFIQFNYDEELELNIAPNKDWCRKVQAIRKVVEKKKIRTIVSPRATIYGGKLIANGMPETEVIDILIYKGLEKAEVETISYGMREAGIIIK